MSFCQLFILLVKHWKLNKFQCGFWSKSKYMEIKKLEKGVLIKAILCLPGCSSREVQFFPAVLVAHWRLSTLSCLIIQSAVSCRRKIFGHKTIKSLKNSAPWPSWLNRLSSKQEIVSSNLASAFFSPKFYSSP